MLILNPAKQRLPTKLLIFDSEQSAHQTILSGHLYYDEWLAEISFKRPTNGKKFGCVC